MLKLTEVNTESYKVEIHKEYLGSLQIQDLVDEKTTNEFIRYIPILKENIIKIKKPTLEVEYEQLIIRANNNEQRNASEYFIIDRQYVTPGGRFDLTGIYWNRNRRRKDQIVPLSFME